MWVLLAWLFSRSKCFVIDSVIKCRHSTSANIELGEVQYLTQYFFIHRFTLFLFPFLFCVVHAFQHFDDIPGCDPFFLSREGGEKRSSILVESTCTHGKNHRQNEASVDDFETTRLMFSDLVCRTVLISHEWRLSGEESLCNVETLALWKDRVSAPSFCVCVCYCSLCRIRVLIV